MGRRFEYPLNEADPIEGDITVRFLCNLQLYFQSTVLESNNFCANWTWPVGVGTRLIFPNEPARTPRLAEVLSRHTVDSESTENLGRYSIIVVWAVPKIQFICDILRLS